MEAPGTTSAEVLELANPGALFGIPEVADLFDRAFGDFPTDAGLVRAWLVEFFPYGRLSVFLGREEGAWKGLLILSDATTPFSEVPQVLHFWAPNAPAVRDALLAKLRAWMGQRGYPSVRAWNGSGKPDPEYVERFPGFQGSVEASIVRFTPEDG